MICRHLSLNLSNLLSISRRYSNKIGFVGLTAIDQPKVDPAPWAPEAAYRVHYVEEFNTIIKKMCKSQHISFINVYDEFTKKGHKKLLRDGLHPNSKGHELLAELIRPFFEKFKVL